MATEEEVANKAAEVKRLRQSLVERRRTREEGERAISSELTMANLEVEEARLRAQIDEEERASTPEAVVTGAAAPISAVKGEMLRAMAAQQAQQSTPAPEAPVPPVVTDEPKPEVPVDKPPAAPATKGTKASAKPAEAGEGK